MKSSTLSRTFELAKLATQVGLKELRSGDMKSRFEQALLITRSLSNLKGAAMKAGQLLSLDLDHYFPPEAIAVLSQLQNSAEAHSLDQIEGVLAQEYNVKKRSKIKKMAAKPIGVASIGQVHRAQFDGQEVVLKIQYPGVSDSIDADLKILKTIAVSFCKITGRKMNLEPLFNEFRSVLNQEVDYLSEAKFQKQYFKNVAKLKTKVRVAYRVPQVIDEMSTGKVLMMTHESGVSLRTWIASNPSPAGRQDVAQAVLNLYFHEFFQWGLVQTDPNWGNFLIDEDENVLNLVILDFGATRKYSREFIQNYIRLLHFAAGKDSGELKKHAIDFGLMDFRESPSAFKAFEELLVTAIKPFFVKKSDSALFDFSDKNHSLESQNAAKALADELVYSPPPYGLIFLHRKLAGVYSILKSLEVQLDISSYWQQMADLSTGKEA